MIYKFRCPKCGYDHFSLLYRDVSHIMTGRHVTDADEGYIEYFDQETIFDKGYIVGYFCLECGHQIPDVGDDEEMFEWIKKNGEVIVR